MIAGIGTDLVEIGRVEEMLQRGSRLTRIYDSDEHFSTSRTEFLRQLN